MTSAALSVSLTQPDNGVSAAEEDRVAIELEQDLPDIGSVDLRDVYDMWTQAKSGKSARSLKTNNCPVIFAEDTTTFTLAFFVWPFPRSAVYSLSATIGDILEPTAIDREREESAVFELSRTVSFDRVIENVTYKWETPAYNSKGEIRPTPVLSVVRDKLVIEEDLFAVARVKFQEIGHRHELEVTVDTTAIADDGEKINIKIDDIAPVITAVWQDEEGEVQTTQLTLELPKCVQEALQICGGQGGGVTCLGSNSTTVVVYYNVCGEDEILDIRLKQGGEDWCG